MIQISNKNFPYFLVNIQCKLPYYCWSFFFIYVVGHLGRAGINLSSRKKFILGSFYSSLLLNAGVLMVWRSSCLAYRALRPIFPLDIWESSFPKEEKLQCMAFCSTYVFLVTHSFHCDGSLMTSSTPEYPPCVACSCDQPCVRKAHKAGTDGKHRLTVPRTVGRDPNGLPEVSTIQTLFRFQSSGFSFI